MQHLWLYYRPVDLETELGQCRDEGRVLAPDLISAIEALIAGGAEIETDPHAQRAIGSILDLAAQAPLAPERARDEPSELPAILAARPAATSAPSAAPPAPLPELDRFHGAWTGRAVGCLLGKPVEGWRRPRMWGYLRDAGRWPLDDFFQYTVPEEIRLRYQLAPELPWGDLVDAMPEDDDTNYTLIGLLLAQRHGLGLSPEHVADFWLQYLPILHVCTAERVAYRNVINGVKPPLSARHRNPYREWIGAQIRGDAFGYVAARQPVLAARLAWQDAAVSHVANGIYGEMWSAAMNAAAFTDIAIEEIIEAGHAQIPERCRLARAVRQVMAERAAGVTYDDAVNRLHERWDETSEHGWCHVISTAVAVTLGLVYGDGEFGRSICRAVQACFDTDCNGATVGSILGARLGRAALPARWVEPIHDTLLTGIAGYPRVRLRDLAEQTHAAALAIRAQQE